MAADREVTEFDLRAEQFKRRDVKPEDYEFRDDGKIVRKDRWINGIHSIRGLVGPHVREFEIDAVIEAVWNAEKARRTLEGLHEKLRYERNAVSVLMGEEESLPSKYAELASTIDTAIRLLAEQAAEHGYMLGGDNDQDA